MSKGGIVGVDVGGTFTDLVMLDPDTGAEYDGNYDESDDYQVHIGILSCLTRVLLLSVFDRTQGLTR